MPQNKKGDQDVGRHEFPSGWSELFGQVSSVMSVLVPGYVDLDAHPEQVKLFPVSVAFGVERGYLNFTIEKTSGQLEVEASSNVELPDELMDEPSIFVDLGAEFLSDVLPVEIVGFGIYLDHCSDISARRFRGARLDLCGGGVLALDPFWTPGIRIGGLSIARRLEEEVVGAGDGSVLDLNQP